MDLALEMLKAEQGKKKILGVIIAVYLTGTNLQIYRYTEEGLLG